MSIYYKRGFSARLKRNVNIVAHSFYLNSNVDYTTSVFICGAGRSGTTWLAEILNSTNEYRFLYEPFNRDHVPECRNLSVRQYLRPDDSDQEHLKVASAIFSGRIRSGWIDQYNRCLFARQRLIKDVRSTLMLKWIRNHFPRMPIIFLIRNPYAVAASRVKEGWRTNLRDVFYAQASLMADHLGSLRGEIDRAECPFERHLIDWCIENLVPFSQLDKGDVYLAFYENIRANPHTELKKLYEFLGRPFDESQLKRLGKLSASTTRKGNGTKVIDSAPGFEGWRNKFTATELAFAERATRAFGLDQIYGPSQLADASKAEGLIGKVKL